MSRYRGYDLNSDAGAPYGTWRAAQEIASEAVPSAFDRNPRPWSYEVASYRGRRLVRCRDGCHYSRRDGHGWTLVASHATDGQAEDTWRGMVDRGVC